MQLTLNAVDNLNNNGAGTQTHNPPLILKLVGCKKVERDGDDKPKTVRYRVILSDGEKSIQGLVLPKLQHLFDENKIPDQSILAISQIGVSKNGKSSFIILHEFTVVQPNSAQESAPPVQTNSQTAASSGVVNTSGNQQFQQLQKQPPPFQGNPQADPNAPITVPIASINPYQTNWTVMGRVSAKSGIKNYNNAKGPGKLFNFNIIDQSGEIRATCFNEQVDQFYDMIQMNKVYYLTQAKVNAARKEFSSLDHNYELVLNSNTSIVLTQANSSNIPKNHYSFKKLTEIELIETNTLIDVIGVIKSANDLTTIMTKNGNEVAKRDVFLVDDSKRSIRLTLWGENATSTKVEGNPIIACKGLRVSEFNGKNLSASTGCTIEVNPEIDESYALRGWFDANGHKENFDSFSTTTPTTSNSKAQISEISSIKDQQVEQSDKPLFFNIIASILHIRNSASMFYPACAADNCNKKVIARENDWFCESCNRSFPNPRYRYTLSANVADHTGQLWISIFDAVGSELLQKSADQIHSIGEADPEQVKEYINVACNKQFIFKCTARNEIWNDVSRIKYTVLSASPIDFTHQSGVILSELSHL